MRHDEPFEWGMQEVDAQRVAREGRFRGSEDPARRAAEAQGWRFATDSLFAILGCPCCKQNPGILREMVAQNRREEVRAIAEVLDEDEDGLIAHLSDMGGGR